MNSKVAFAILQPACVKVAKLGDLDSIKDLKYQLLELLNDEKDKYPETNCSFINELTEYLIFPILLIYQKPCKRSESLEEELVNLILLVLENSIIEDWSFFERLFFHLVLILTSKDNTQKISSVSEECKITTLQAISTLCKQTKFEILGVILTDKFRPQLGHAVFICLRIAENEKNRTLCVSAMEAILALGFNHSWDTLSTHHQYVISEAFVNFFPGIITSTYKISTASDIQGHKVTQTAVNCFSYYVKVVMRDEFLITHVPSLGMSETCLRLHAKLMADNVSNKEKSKNNSKKSKFNIPGPVNDDPSYKKLKNVDISQKWIDTTSQRVSLYVSAMGKLITHSHWSVRLNLVHWAGTIITSCPKSLNNCLVTALEVTVALSKDDCQDVAKASAKVVKAGEKVLQQPEMYSIWELIEERIFSLATSIVTTARRQEDSKTLAVLRQLSGCLQILGKDKVSRLLRRTSHMNRIFGSLVFLYTYSIDDHEILAEKTLMEDTLEIMEVKPELGRNFRYFLPSSGIYDEGAKLCRLLGGSTNVSEVVNACLDVIQSPTHLKESLLILTFMLTELETSSDSTVIQDREDGIQNILNCIEYFEVMALPTQIQVNNNINDNFGENNKDGVLVPAKENKSSLTVDCIKRNIITVKNSIELLGVACTTLGTKFDVFLSQVLWMIMEKAGDPNVLISYSATCSLKQISVALGYKDKNQFIQDKVSQFWFALSLRLRRLDEYPSAPLVLKVVLGSGISEDMYSFIDELVEEVLLVLNSSRQGIAVPLLNVLLVYTLTVSKYKNKLLEESSPVTSTKFSDAVCSSESTSLIEFLSDLHKDTETSEIQTDEEKVNLEEIPQHLQNDKTNYDNFQTEEEEEAAKLHIPNYITLIVQIFEKCSFILYGNDRQINLIILNIILNGSSVLSSYEDQALPVFHKLWKPLTLLLNNDDFVVMLKCLEVCVVLISCSGDFLRKRTISDVLPKVVSFLAKHSKSSLNKCKNSGYHVTPEFKAQVKFLRILPKLIVQLNLSVLDMVMVVDAFIPYLDTRQPEELWHLAEEAIKSLSSIHRQVLWISLSSLQPNIKLCPASSSFKSIKLRCVNHDQTLPKSIQELFLKM